MKLVELLNKANEGYVDGFLAEYYNPETGEEKPKDGEDGLAQFIVVELRETFDEKETDNHQRCEAIRALENAVEQLNNVIYKLEFNK